VVVLVVFDLVFLVLAKKLTDERPQSDLICVKWEVKPSLCHSVTVFL